MLAQLLAQAKLGAYLAVALDVGLFKVVLKAAAAADHLEQATAGMVVVLVLLEVLVQVVDALGQQSDLHLGGTGVALVDRVLGDDFSFGHFYFLHIFYKSPETEYCAWRCGKHSPRFKVFLFYHSVNAL